MAPRLADVRRAADRFRTVSPGIESRHCFSFGAHYNPGNTSFGALVTVNDEIIQPGTGFAPHRHVDVEIVTWPVRGLLHHEDSTGRRGDIAPGVVQVLSAGQGVVHSETAPATERRDANSAAATRFVQMWLRPDQSGGAPRYGQMSVDAEMLAADLVVVASGRPEHLSSAALRIGTSGAALLASRPSPGQSVRLPDAELAHVYVVRGAVELETGKRLDEGDSARLRGVSGSRMACLRAAELLVWQLEAG